MPIHGWVFRKKVIPSAKFGRGSKVNFNIKHTVDNKKFIVHTFDKISEEVLGTSFNLDSRGDQIAVVLKQGSIKLQIDGEHGAIKYNYILSLGKW